MNTAMKHALGLFVSLSMLLMSTTQALAAPSSSSPLPNPFLGKWEAVDLDGSIMYLDIAGKPTGPFQITWTDKYISYCNGEAGIVRGTGSMNESDPELLDADLELECFTTRAKLDLDLSFRYHPSANTLSVLYSFGQVTIWHRPGKPQAPPPVLNLRVNYGHDWVESFYEAGHTVWVLLTESDGVTVKATMQAVTEPKDFWGGETGFTSAPDGWIDPNGSPMVNPPDIQPYDWVFGWVDNGAAAQVQIGEISGKIHLAENYIEGTVAAPWFTEVQLQCLDWTNNPPLGNVEYGSVAPDGSSSYSCSWDGWDIQPGDTIGVGYFGTDGNWVSNAFPAPNPRIVASAAGDWFWVTGFYPGPIQYAIYESSAAGAAQLQSGQKEAADLEGITIFEPADHGLDLQPGNVVTVTDGVNEKSLVLATITMDLFDVANDVMSGTAPLGREVWAWAGPSDWQQPVKAEMNTETGAWFADFKPIGFDITEDMQPWSYAHIYDEDGDANEAGAPLPPQVTMVVTDTGDTLADDGQCTLREAVIAANINQKSGGAEGECPAGLNLQTDTIVLTGGASYSLTREPDTGTLIDGDLDLWDNAADFDLVIRVEGEGRATISQATVTGDRVLENHGAAVQIENLVLTGGGNVGGGGGLLNVGTMIILGCEILDNSVGWDGGGIYNANESTLNIESSVIRGNTSSAFAGGIQNKGTLTMASSDVRGNTSVFGGGGINNEGSLTIDGSTLSANTSGQGGALYNSGTALVMNGTLVGGFEVDDANTADGGGGLFSLGVLTVNDSQILGNRGNYGGGLFNWIGGLLTVSNSVVSQNTANQGGGLHNKEGSTAFIQNGTLFADNSAAWGGGAIHNWGTITITDSVIRNNQSDSADGDAVFSGAYDTSAASINSSCIFGNGDIAVSTDRSYALSAQSNWWGAASGPAHSSNPGGAGDSVSDNVDFSSWLTEPPALCAP